MIEWRTASETDAIECLCEPGFWGLVLRVGELSKWVMSRLISTLKGSLIGVMILIIHSSTV